MSGTVSPSNEGPSYAPPQLPAGWIAQWDGASRKYYYVQLSTGVSQWETPTEAAKTGNTPMEPTDHPYGTPQPELITHPDGSQTVKHADGTMEPIMADGSRGMDGPNGDRGIGQMAVNALLGSKTGGQGGMGGQGIAGLANQFLSGGGRHSSHATSPMGNIAGKLVGQLAQNLMSPNKHPTQQNYHGAQSAPNVPQGGIPGAVMGGLAHLMGGKTGQVNPNQDQNYGYSNSGTAGSYTGEAPMYRPPGSNFPPQAPASAPAYDSSPPNPHPRPHDSYSVPPPPGPGNPGQSYPPPPGNPPMGQQYDQSYSHSPGMNPYSQGQPQYSQGPSAYGSAPQQQYYPPPPPPPPQGAYGSYGGDPSSYGGPQQYQGPGGYGGGY